MKFRVINICTGRSIPASLVKETKCYYVVECEGLHYRFHKATLTIEWQHLALRVES